MTTQEKASLIKEEVRKIFKLKKITQADKDKANLLIEEWKVLTSWKEEEPKLSDLEFLIKLEKDGVLDNKKVYGER
jgi:hypothetical protein